MGAVAGALDDFQPSARNGGGNGARLVDAGQRILRADDHKRRGIHVSHDRVQIELAIAFDVTPDGGAIDRMSVHLVDDRPDGPVFEGGPTERVQHQSEVYSV